MKPRANVEHTGVCKEEFYFSVEIHFEGVKLAPKVITIFLFLFLNIT